jgi:pimeloyl-ACP methyl ester carboxylesterase
MPFVQSHGISIFYEIHGDHGSPLIMIHGYNSSTIDWYAPHIEQLSSKHRVILFDNRGVGQTDKPREAYSMEQFAADTVGVLDALEIDKAHVLGESMGGMIAQHVAVDFSDRVLGLVLGGTSGGGPGNPKMIAPSDEVMQILTRPSTGDVLEDHRAFWPILFTPAYIETHRDLLETRLRAKLTYSNNPGYVLKAQMGAIGQHDTFDRLRHIACPTLVQTGLEDVVVPPENSRILADRIPGARLIEYPNAAHVYLDEVGSPAIDDILTFLSEVDAEKG